jgi:XRE family aerobic/anaerobic benzoate catabolism transcriptional regulator
VSDSTTTPRSKPDGAAGKSPATDAQFAAGVGRLVRLGRARRGMTRRQLAEASGISERYLAQIESGQGNPSVIVLKAIAEAIEVSIAGLIPPHGARNAALNDVLAVLGRVPSTEFPGIARMIEQRLAEHQALDRARRIALVGLRGAGKSTLGRLLAQSIGCPFVELNRMVEQEYGASVPMLIEMSGLATFRRYERACLERVIAEHDAVVIETAGGIVSSPETYSLLLQRVHTIWIKASPEEHMGRVMEQGDFRPMAENREAMADLLAILEARRADYARAEASLDTAGHGIEESFAQLAKIASALVNSGAAANPASASRAKPGREARRNEDL